MTTTIKPGDIVYVTKELPDRILKFTVDKVDGNWIWTKEPPYTYLSTTGSYISCKLRALYLNEDCFLTLQAIANKAEQDSEFCSKYIVWLNNNRQPYVSHEKKELERAHKTNRELNRRNQKLESRLIQAEKLLKNSPSNLAFQVWQLQKELTVCKMRLKDDRNIESN